MAVKEDINWSTKQIGTMLSTAHSTASHSTVTDVQRWDTMMYKKKYWAKQAG